MSSSKARFFNPAVVGLIMLSFFLGTSEYTVIGIPAGNCGLDLGFH